MLAAWKRCSLSVQFAMAASAVVVCGMLVIGSWVSDRIEAGVVHRAAAATALYMDSYVEPRVQELAQRGTLSLESRRVLDSIANRATPDRSVVVLRIWRGDAIVYSSEPEREGAIIAPDELRNRAFLGHVTAELSYGSEDEDTPVRLRNLPLLEIYAPVRQTGSNNIIALAETYEVATGLADELARARRQSWLIVITIAAVMLGLLFGIVDRGSRTIERQQNLLEERVHELSDLLAENEELRGRIAATHQRVMEVNQRSVSRAVADLNDGPVQLVGLALLTLDSLDTTKQPSNGSGPDQATDLETIRSALSDALKELRTVSSWLTPREVEKISLSEALRLAARRHERRSGIPVACEIEPLSWAIPLPVKTCLFRFAQDALARGVQAGSNGRLSLSAIGSGPGLEVSVYGTGAGNTRASGTVVLGELRDSIEALGGSLACTSDPHRGFRMTARFRLSPEADAHA